MLSETILEIMLQYCVDSNYCHSTSPDTCHNTCPLLKLYQDLADCIALALKEKA